MSRSYRTFRPKTVLAAGVFLALAIGWAPIAALAQAGDLFDGLAAQPVTLMDAGIKRMRAGAQTAAVRLSTAVGPPAQYRITFDNACAASMSGSMSPSRRKRPMKGSAGRGAGSRSARCSASARSITP